MILTLIPLTGHKATIVVIEPDKCSGDGNRTGFSIKKITTTHYLPFPEGLPL